MTPNPSIRLMISAIQNPCTECRGEIYCVPANHKPYSTALSTKQKKEYAAKNGNLFEFCLARSVTAKSACRRRPTSQRCRTKILVDILSASILPLLPINKTFQHLTLPKCGRWHAIGRRPAATFRVADRGARGINPMGRYAYCCIS